MTTTFISLDALHRAHGGKSTVLADDWQVAKKVAGPLAQGSELGFTATKAKEGAKAAGVRAKGARTL